MFDGEECDTDPIALFAYSIIRFIEGHHIASTPILYDVGYFGELELQPQGSKSSMFELRAAAGVY